MRPLLKEYYLRKRKSLTFVELLIHHSMVCNMHLTDVDHGMEFIKPA